MLFIMHNPNLPHLNINLMPSVKNYQVVSFDGDLDRAGQNAIQEQIDKLVSNFSYTFLVFDFNNLNFINSEGIGLLMTIHAHLVKTKKGLIIIRAKSHVKDVLGAIGIFSLLPYYETLEDFLKKNN